MIWVIYCFTHTRSGRRYVGLTSQTVRRRWSQHISKAKAGGSWHFSNAIRKYGPEAFSCEVLEVCFEVESAAEAEKRWIATFRSNIRRFGFNLQQGGTRCPPPVPHAWDREGHREKVSSALKRYYAEAGNREKASLLQRAVRARPSVQAKISAAMRANWRNPDFRERMLEAKAQMMRDPVKRERVSSNFRKLNEVTRKRTHCRNGHPWAENLLTNNQGNRVCRTCKNTHERERYHQRKRSKPM